jgi:hypothetical protein
MALEGADAIFSVDVPDWILKESEWTLESGQTNPTTEPVGQPYGYDTDVPLQDFLPGSFQEGHATTCAGLSGLAAIELENTCGPAGTNPPFSLPLNTVALKRQEALDYLGDKWNNDTDFCGLGEGNRGNPYSHWTCCRGLRLTEQAMGLPSDSLTLMNGGVPFVWSSGEENPPSGVIAPAGSPREGYSHWIERTQLGDGSWNGGGVSANCYTGPVLESCMNILCLSPTVFGPPPDECPDEPDPRTQGYWHRQCLGLPAPQGIDPGRNGRGPQAPNDPDFMPAIYDCVNQALEDQGFFGETTCSALDADPANDKCEKALKQLAAVMANLCSDRLGDGCEIDVSAEGCTSTTVGDLVDELTMLIDNGDCHTANACAAAVNEGLALVDGGAIGDTYEAIDAPDGPKNVAPHDHGRPEAPEAAPVDVKSDKASQRKAGGD